ncbi:SpoIVB peptidase [Blautia sp. MSJ-19]|uniref:SpoIVB peptidase n=1 Tax=Blautia sp. MSJ-19 TaxID=2841517 RepID=UPI001C0F16D4|nr:SpoIVB peptidase [Blautia sp. MSJ-19]MBU5480839.1 SpoIVB peptidase [Blautia sp. MSJ-19]
MDRKKKYRHILFWIIGLDLLAVVWLGYRYLDRKIPDELYVSEGQEQQVKNVLDYPLLSFDDAITVSGDGSYLLSGKILGMIPFKDVKVIPADSTSVLVSGSTVGIYMETEGVLVIDTGEIISQDGQSEDPAKNIVEPGDYIVAFNDKTVRSKKDLIEDLRNLNQEQVTLQVIRKGKSIPLAVNPVKDVKGDYKLGIWVRDNTQGIGTLTFVDQDRNYGALGHGISDVDTGELLHINDGALYQAQIVGIQKGSSGNPGELSGLIHYEAEKVIGSIDKNCEQGIYGKLSLLSEDLSLKKMEVAYKQELETGPASVLCCVDGEVREFEAEITRIDLNHEDSNKSFVIQVTDPQLLEMTGGIVQGMSGSPVIQNGKFAGAITHVFVQDSTGGYGIFAETMLENIEQEN